MKKYVCLFMFLIVFAYGSLLVDDNVHKYSPFIMDESETLNDSYMESFHPIDDDNKISIGKLGVILFLALSVTYAFPFFVLHTRRLILLTPVFYQSNYVVLPLLHKSN
ncbi:hypothetical protein ACFOUV_17150 [Oceanobacillus longus]|uniref:Uncharacterized protein n=1 Tax=Oceanobacillus longus TaxID=930120 RepID=A0ABV8H2X8_9BACI